MKATATLYLEKAALYALCDLLAIMPRYDPDGDHCHLGWKTIEELYDALNNSGVDVSDYENEVSNIKINNRI